MLSRLLVVACLVFGLVAPGFARARPLVLMLGDSTTFGTIDVNFGQADVTTAEALQAMLRIAGRENRYRRAKVRNFGVPGASTRDWVVGPNPNLCAVWGPHLPFLAAACERQVPLVDVVPENATAVLITLGYVDGVFGVPVEETVANVTAIAGRFAASRRVLVAPPFVPLAGNEFQAPRDVRRQALLNAGLVSGPDWPVFPLVDVVHLTPGGYAAAAGLWLDVLR